MIDEHNEALATLPQSKADQEAYINANKMEDLPQNAEPTARIQDEPWDPVVLRTDPRLRHYSDSGPVPAGPQQVQALSSRAYSATNATSSDTRSEAIYSSSSVTGPTSSFPSSRPSAQHLTPRTTSSSIGIPRVSLRYHCGHCDKTFDRPSDGRKHEKYHLPPEERKHVCKVCPSISQVRSFADKRDLERHLWTAHRLGESPVRSCESCGDSFNRGDSLKRHTDKYAGKCRELKQSKKLKQRSARAASGPAAVGSRPASQSEPRPSPSSHLMYQLSGQLLVQAEPNGTIASVQRQSGSINTLELPGMIPPPASGPYGGIWPVHGGRELPVQAVSGAATTEVQNGFGADDASLIGTMFPPPEGWPGNGFSHALGGYQHLTESQPGAAAASMQIGITVDIDPETFRMILLSESWPTNALLPAFDGHQHLAESQPGDATVNVQGAPGWDSTPENVGTILPPEGNPDSGPNRYAGFSQAAAKAWVDSM